MVRKVKVGEGYMDVRQCVNKANWLKSVCQKGEQYAQKKKKLEKSIERQIRGNKKMKMEIYGNSFVKRN